MRCLITAGPTREHLDPVRFLSNGSSGKMGYALAVAAAARGWVVELVSGPVALAAPAGVDVTRVVSAQQMFDACAARFETCDVFIAVAAVADYRPRTAAPLKVEKAAGPVTIELEPTVDILRTLAARKRPEQVVVGFAAETHDLERRARRKLEQKNCNWLVANEVFGPRVGMDSDDNAILLLARDGRRMEYGPALKSAVATFVLDQIASELVPSAR